MRGEGVGEAANPRKSSGRTRAAPGVLLAMATAVVVWHGAGGAPLHFAAFSERIRNGDGASIVIDGVCCWEAPPGYWRQVEWYVPPTSTWENDVRSRGAECFFGRRPTPYVSPPWHGTGLPTPVPGREVWTRHRGPSVWIAIGGWDIRDRLSAYVARFGGVVAPASQVEVDAAYAAAPADALPNRWEFRDGQLYLVSLEHWSVRIPPEAVPQLR